MSKGRRVTRGKRYDTEPKLNIKKVFAVVIAVVVLIMCIYIIKGLLTKDDATGKITSSNYFAVYKDNKYGVINQTGEFVIDPSYEEMIVIPNSKEQVFICTYDTNYKTGEYKTKVLNASNKEILTEYKKVEAIQNKDQNGNLIYEKDVLRVQNNGKYGIIEIEGKELLPTEYDEISAISGVEGVFKIIKDKKYGIANSSGKIIIEPVYTDITILGKDNKLGFIVKTDNGKYGIVDYSNNEVLEAKYDKIKKIHNNDMYVVTESGRQKVINKDGKNLITAGFDEVIEILSDSIIIKKNGKYGLLDTKGKTLIPATYNDLIGAKTGYLIAKKGKKYGVISTENKQELEFKYELIEYNEKADIYIADDSNYNSNILNSELEIKLAGILLDINTEKGYIKIREADNYKYYNFKFEEKQEKELFPNRTLFLSKQDGKYGFVDKNGEIVVKCIYDDATEQNDSGYVAIKKDGKWGSIDSKGNIVQEPTYNLDNYLLIDFIGRWHLGADLNMNYYNQL